MEDGKEAVKADWEQQGARPQGIKCLVYLGNWERFGLCLEGSARSGRAWLGLASLGRSEANSFAHPEV